MSAPLVDYYFTQIVGNPNSLPVIKATSNFSGIALIDGDQYQPGNAANPGGSLGYNSTNVFYRQIRNLVLDTTAVPPKVGAIVIHWPTAQATSLQNLVFRMSEANGTQHQGMLIESGQSLNTPLSWVEVLTSVTKGPEDLWAISSSMGV